MEKGNPTKYATLLLESALYLKRARFAVLWENKWLFMGFLIRMTVKIFYLFNVRLANIKSRILVRNFNSALLFLYPAAMFLFKISNFKRARAEFFTQIRIDKKGEKMP